MVLIRDVVRQTLTTGYLSVEALIAIAATSQNQVRLRRPKRFHDLAASCYVRQGEARID
jgi:hypothetical protein